jgi:hypothetical protein
MDDKTPSGKSNFPAPTPIPTNATGSARVPLGAASVVAAGGDPRYLPVPMVTVPQARPPMPPPARIPEAPDPAQYVNAFTPPLREGNPPMMAYGYGPMPMAPPMPIAAQGYPMPMQPMMGQGYPVTMQQATPQGYPMPAMAAQQAMAYANPAMDRPGVRSTGNMSVQQRTYVLQSSLYPAQREMAIDQLSASDWRANPHIVHILMTTATDDPSPTVRAAAASALARMGVTK